jgi:hypothetical protein
VLQAFRVAEQVRLAGARQPRRVLRLARPRTGPDAGRRSGRRLPAALCAAAAAGPAVALVLGQRRHRRHVLPPPSGDRGRDGRCAGTGAEADRRWAERFGRSWGVVERYRCDGPTPCSSPWAACAARRARRSTRCARRGLRWGWSSCGCSVRCRLRRCAPRWPGVRDVVVLDRNHSPGRGRRAAPGTARRRCTAWADAPRVHGVLAGVGGVNVSVAHLEALAHAARAAPGPLDAETPCWIR